LKGEIEVKLREDNENQTLFKAVDSRLEVIGDPTEALARDC